MDSFGERLSAAVGARGPLCVGIDPHDALLVEWGLPLTPAGLRAFCETVVEAVGDRVAVVKPQSAFFERFGSAGIAVLESTIRQSREAGALVLLDVKRGDIGSTASAYAEAYLAPDAPLRADAVTVSPYLGFGALEPFLQAARTHGGGVFVVALSSNPEGRTVQHARGADGRTVAQAIVDDVAGCNEGERPLGSIGVVVGATTGGGAGQHDPAGGAGPHDPTGGADRDGTRGGTGLDLSRLNGPVLAPGLGAQGATADDLTIVFKGLSGVLLPAYSREILRHGPGVGALREAAKRSLAECRKVR
jgi:orotidine-5'-phosphate decarboxylase